MEQQLTTLQHRNRLSPRERLYAIMGGLVAIALIATVWVLTGREAPPQSAAVGEVDRPAPNIMLPSLGGGEINLSDYTKANTIILVNFWGTLCEPCRKELPALQAAYEQLRDQGFVIIGVNLTDNEQTRGTTEVQTRSFLDQYGVTYPIALDTEGIVAKEYRVSPLPTNFFINTQGRIRFIKIGELTTADVVARFMQLKQEAVTQYE